VFAAVKAYAAEARIPVRIAMKTILLVLWRRIEFLPDGSQSLVRVRYRPVPRGPDPRKG
jgi:hypothetical protein